MKAAAAMNEKSLSGQEVKSKKLVGPKGPVKARPLGLLVSANLDEFTCIV